MKFLPYKTCTIKTTLLPEEVRKKLEDNIEPSKLLRFNFWGDKKFKPYEGKVYGNIFKVSRIIGGRNSFLPVIEGKIVKLSTGTEVRIRMRMAVYTYIAWFCILSFLFFCIIKVTSLMVQRREFYAAYLILIGVTALAYFFAIISFNVESSKSKRFFDELFS
jgi:hypothetical protein